MNKNQAQARGLRFTGIYDRSKEVVQKRLEEERKKYPKAKLYLVTQVYKERVLSSSSRPCTSRGYSVYGDAVYQAYQQLEMANNYLNVVGPTAQKMAQEEYNRKMKDTEDRMEGWLTAKQVAEDILAGRKLTTTQV